MKGTVTMFLAVILVLVLVELPHTVMAQGRTTTQQCPYRRDGSCYEILDEKGRVVEAVKRVQKMGEPTKPRKSTADA